MKILVVDDMDSWRNFHKDFLEEIFIMNGCEIHVADSASNALNKLYENASNPYDIIVTDLQMEDNFSPQFAGEWLVKQIQTLSQYSKSRIIISSGAYNIKHIAQSYNVEYIPKRIACTDRQEYERIIEGVK